MRRWRWLLVGASVALTGAGCGSALSDQQLIKGNGQGFATEGQPEAAAGPAAGTESAAPEEAGAVDGSAGTGVDGAGGGATSGSGSGSSAAGGAAGRGSDGGLGAGRVVIRILRVRVGGRFPVDFAGPVRRGRRA